MAGAGESPADAAYAALVRQVLAGAEAPSRAGPVRKVVGAQVRAPVRLLPDGAYEFPLLTRKLVPLRAVATELLWFMRGETSAEWLEARGVTIWSADADRALRERGSRALGPIYGAQWRGGADGPDQLSAVLDSLAANPLSRRHLVCAWNPRAVPAMALPPCHYAFQFVVAAGRLSCVVTMRSGDVGLGVPFNLASYALLLCLVSRAVGIPPAEVVIDIADAHAYASHSAALRELLARPARPAPRLRLPPGVDARTFPSLGGDPAATPNFADWLEGYQHSGRLPLPLEVG